MSILTCRSYSHTHHFVTIEQFDGYVEGLLTTDEVDGAKKERLTSLMSEPVWGELRLSSYWRHNLVNRGLSGPFTEYFAHFSDQMEVDFWGAKIQPIDITYLRDCAIPRAYQSTVSKTQEVLAKRVKQLVDAGAREVRIASLACGTMYDVLEAPYDDTAFVRFSGFDIDEDSLKLAGEKANALGLAEKLNTSPSDVVKDPLDEASFDIVVCNGFSFYITDDELLGVIQKVKNALKPDGIFLMSFIQPAQLWLQDDDEKVVGALVNKIYNAFPMNWSSNFRTADQVIALLAQKGLKDITVHKERHDIHPLAQATKM